MSNRNKQGTWTYSYRSDADIPSLVTSGYAPSSGTKAEYNAMKSRGIGVTTFIPNNGGSSFWQKATNGATNVLSKGTGTANKKNSIGRNPNSVPMKSTGTPTRRDPIDRNPANVPTKGAGNVAYAYGPAPATTTFWDKAKNSTPKSAAASNRRDPIDRNSNNAPLKGAGIPTKADYKVMKPKGTGATAYNLNKSRPTSTGTFWQNAQNGAPPAPANKPGVAATPKPRVVPAAVVAPKTNSAAFNAVDTNNNGRISKKEATKLRAQIAGHPQSAAEKSQDALASQYLATAKGKGGQIKSNADPSPAQTASPKKFKGKKPGPG